MRNPLLFIILLALIADLFACGPDEASWSTSTQHLSRCEEAAEYISRCLGNGESIQPPSSCDLAKADLVLESDCTTLLRDNPSVGKDMQGLETWCETATLLPFCEEGARVIRENVRTLRETKQCPSCLLMDADLSAFDLAGADLSSANLTNATLMDADLSGADLGAANFSNATMKRAKLAKANLTGVNLYLASLGWADLTEAVLVRADLSRSMLLHANLTRANLERAILNGAVAYQTNFTDANMSDARLYWTYLLEANLQGVELTSVDLRNTDFIAAKIGDLTICTPNAQESNCRCSGSTPVGICYSKLDGTQIWPPLVCQATDEVVAKTKPIRCGDLIRGSTLNDDALRLYPQYGCTPGWVYSGAEQVYVFRPEISGQVEMALVVPDPEHPGSWKTGVPEESGDLDILILQDGCNALEHCTHGGQDAFYLSAEKGHVYYIIVDGLQNAGGKVSEGAFTLQIDC